MWVVRYQCGCSSDAQRRGDLFEYCETHGSDACEWIHVKQHENKTHPAPVQGGKEKRVRPLQALEKRVGRQAAHRRRAPGCRG